MATLPTSIEEVKQADGQVINGVDNPNILSVDSTAPFATKADEIQEPEQKPEEKPAEEGKETQTEKKPEEPKVEEPKVPAAKPKDSVEKRIGDLTKKWRSAERERDFERLKRAEIEVELNKLKGTALPAERPNPDNFEDDETYQDALADWRIEQRVQKRQEESVKKVEESQDLTAAAEIEQEISDMRDRGLDAYGDFEAVVYNKELDITPGMLEIVLRTEIPEHILYYLGKNPDRAAEISKLPLLQAAQTLGKIEVKVAADIPSPSASQTGSEPKPEPSVKKTTNAPPPITPVRTDGVVDKDPEKMTPKEYRAWRERNKG